MNFFLTMANIITYQNIDLSSWITLYSGTAFFLRKVTNDIVTKGYSGGQKIWIAENEPFFK